ncbi:hypothetical protein LCGC14_1237120 [marine sediment metagenome]|uniref:DUF3955 domain-containing protein n=1 Tax=marine sediment metagenome TaxID=412755 RepID=A0A0F9L6Y8_9ZZZZ
MRKDKLFWGLLLIVGIIFMFPSISLMIREAQAGIPLTDYGLISPTVIMLLFGILIVGLSILGLKGDFDKIAENGRSAKK